MRQLHASYQLCLLTSSHLGRRLGLLCLATCFLAGIVLAGNIVRGHGTCTGTVSLTPIGGGKADVQIETTGQITHLGKSTVSIHSVADFSGAVPVPVPPTTGLVTAANGDTVSFTLKLKAQAVNSGVFDVTWPFDVTGVSCLFDGAVGR